MKKSGFIISFMACQLLLVFFYIYHQNMLIQASYQKQKYEKKKGELSQKLQDIKHSLEMSHDLGSIKEFAVNAGMQKITLDQVRQVPHE